MASSNGGTTRVLVMTVVVPHHQQRGATVGVYDGGNSVAWPTTKQRLKVAATTMMLHYKQQRESRIFDGDSSSVTFLAAATREVMC